MHGHEGKMLDRIAMWHVSHVPVRNIYSCLVWFLVRVQREPLESRIPVILLPKRRHLGVRRRTWKRPRGREPVPHRLEVAHLLHARCSEPFHSRRHCLTVGRIRASIAERATLLAKIVVDVRVGGRSGAWSLVAAVQLI